MRAERQRREHREKLAAAAAANGVPEGGIHLVDFRKFKGIPKASVDLIFTDPPYGKDADPNGELYLDLATLANDWLKPGGWCLAYCGQRFLPDVLSRMQQNLSYGWTFAAINTGGDLRFRKLHLFNRWKPIVGFYKPPLHVDWEYFMDAISGGREKSLHEWQQSESEASYFVEKLCPAGGLVVDPFCGSGTTLAAAKKLGRQWIGCEIDEGHVATARARVAEAAS